nr:CRACD-like protein [Dasypus novemcinctus]
MISTRVMDLKLREAAEGLGEDGAGKKKSKFKTFKKFFGKKKRKEAPSSTGGSTWKRNPAKSEVLTAESGPVGYDSEDELEESRGALGSRALSHDSIFIPESGQDPPRPVRVFSQENVCDRIKALQLKIQCNVKMGPPPPPGSLPAKQGGDAGMSSEDDGLPRSPPEMSLLHDTGPGTIIKASPHPRQRAASSPVGGGAVTDSSSAPPADFSHPPEPSSCLDSSAARHKLLVKPRNQRSSKLRRLASRAQSESLSDLTGTPEEEDDDGDRPPATLIAPGSPGSGRRDLVPVWGAGPGGTQARRARLRHCPALSASTEEGDAPPSRPASPEATRPGRDEAPPAGSPPPPPEGAPHPEPGSEPRGEEPGGADGAAQVAREPGGAESPSACVPEEDTAPPETVATATPETCPGPDGRDKAAQEEAGPALEVPSPDGAEREPTAPAPSPQPPKSCLKHKAPSGGAGRSASPTPPTSEPPRGEPAPCSLDRETTPPGAPKAEQAQSPQGGPERRAEPRGGKKFSVSPCRLRPPLGGVHLPEGASPGGPPGVRLPLLKSGLAWRSEAALDDLQGLPEPQDGKLDHGDAGSRAAQAPRDPGPAAQEPPPGEDRGPFAIKLRSTSLSFKYRAAPSAEQRGVKRYSAEIRLDKAGLALLPKDDKCPSGAAPSPRGARSPSDRAKGKAPPLEPLGSKPPLPRKPLLQALTLPCPPAAPHAGPGELEQGGAPTDSRKEGRAVERRPPRVAEKGPSPVAAGPGADCQPMPAWVTIARQKRRGAPDQPPSQEDRPGARSLKSETGKQAKAPERAQESTKQADFVRSKSFLIVPAKPATERKEGTTFHLKEGLQRGLSLSHQNLAAQSAAMTEKELSQLKRASYASADQPSWMELARKKAQAWSDMPQIIK